VKQSIVYSSNYTLQAKNKFKEMRGREIHTVNLYWFTLSQEQHPVLIKPLSIPLCSQTRLDYNTHQSGDLEPFKNTHVLWQSQHRIQNTLWIYTPTIITEIQLLREKEWSHLIQSQIEKNKIQCNPIPLFERIQSFNQSCELITTRA